MQPTLGKAAKKSAFQSRIDTKSSRHPAKRLVQPNSHCRRKIQASFTVNLWNAHGSIGESRKQPLIEAVSFAAKDKPIIAAEFDRPMGAGRLGSEQPEPTLPDNTEKRVGAVVHEKSDARPVIHAASLEVSIVQNESQRTNQMKLGASRHAKPTDVPRVRRDLRLDEGYLEMMRRKHEYKKSETRNQKSESNPNARMTNRTRHWNDEADGSNRPFRVA